MSPTLVIGLLAAILLFWAVGAYNRLVRLRSAAIQAFATLEVHFRQYVTLVQTLDASTHGEAMQSLSGLLGAMLQFDTSLRAARLQPLDDLAVRTLVSAHETVHDAWLRLRSEPPDLAGSPLPEALQQQWQQIAQQADAARAEFNRNVQAYNQAINLFPARVLAGVFGFRAARTL